MTIDYNSPADIIESPVSFDAGGRYRIGHITTLADLKVLNTDEPLLLENVGTGTATFSSNTVILNADPGQYLIRRSRRYYPYFSGKSQQAELTFTGFQPRPGVMKRLGYYSSSATAPYDTNYDGFVLESIGETVTLKVYRNGSTILSVDQGNWNICQLAGHDWSGFNVVLMDYLWLGGAVLRLFVKTSRGFQLCHMFNYAGNDSGAFPFTLSPNHSIRYEIRNSSGSASNEFTYVCSQVATEGSLNESGKTFSINTTQTAIALADNTITYPILGIRKRSGFRDAPVHVWNFGGFSNTNDQMLLTLRINPTIVGTPTWSTFSGHPAIESAKGDGTLQVSAGTGTIISSIYIAQDSIVPSNLLQLDFLSWLGSTIQNVSDEIWLCGSPITTNVSAFGSLMFKIY